MFTWNLNDVLVYVQSADRNYLQCKYQRLAGYEVHGLWSIELHRESKGLTDFEAVFT